VVGLASVVRCLYHPRFLFFQLSLCHGELYLESVFAIYLKIALQVDLGIVLVAYPELLLALDHEILLVI
jgi:hypothetical protein